MDEHTMQGIITSYAVKPTKEGGSVVSVTLAVPATPAALGLAGDVGVYVEVRIERLQASMGLVPTDPRTGELPPDDLPTDSDGNPIMQGRPEE